MAARQSDETASYPLAVRQHGPWQIDPVPLFAAIVQDLRRNELTGTMSRRFHNGIVGILADLARLLRDAVSINRVCLSGGTFNNGLVFEPLVRKLESDDFEVFTCSNVPTGDGGLSLGQALIAAHASPPESRDWRLGNSQSR